MNKGEFNGTCNLSRCTTGKPANWYNHGSLKYYCEECAGMLSSDPVNKADAYRLFGHELCTEGQHFSQEAFEPEPIIFKMMPMDNIRIYQNQNNNPWPSPKRRRK